jgi:hypothetical protein
LPAYPAEKAGAAARKAVPAMVLPPTRKKSLRFNRGCCSLIFNTLLSLKPRLSQLPTNITDVGKRECQVD